MPQRVCFVYLIYDLYSAAVFAVMLSVSCDIGLCYNDTHVAVNTLSLNVITFP